MIVRYGIWDGRFGIAPYDIWEGHLEPDCFDAKFKTGEEAANHVREWDTRFQWIIVQYCFPSKKKRST